MSGRAVSPNPQRVVGRARRLGRTVAIIPARGGSKGIPHKNVMDFCGEPLVVWSIRQALQSAAVGEVAVSSDDAGILAVAERAGALPILRPAGISDDTASSESALAHALSVLEQRGDEPVDLVVFIQATSPLRLAEQIDGAVALYLSGSWDCVFSAAEFEDLCVWQRGEKELKCLTYDPSARRRRQESPPNLVENGSIYVLSAEFVRSGRELLSGSCEAYSMPTWSIFEIDEPSDIAVCETLMQRFVLGMTPGAVPEKRCGQDE